jgi:heme/copper-type cytochrome/quinol oxidase subunit 2
VQHGFSVRKWDALSKQMSHQMLTGYERLVPVQFDETGTYHLVCNEFCGTGHRTMHATFVVQHQVPDVEPKAMEATTHRRWRQQTPGSRSGAAPRCRRTPRTPSSSATRSKQSRTSST